MKKLLAMLLVLVALCGVLSGCNKSLFDTTYNFSTAQILMPDGTVVSGEVSSWTDFEDGDQVQVTIDGKTYLTHSTNVVLIAD